MAESASPRRRAALALLALTALALLLRAWAPDRLGVDHFDEGVYAFSAAELADPPAWPGLYPNQVRFAPPVHFGLAGLLGRAAGIGADAALHAVSIACGVLGVALLGYVGLRWLGAGAGVAAAALLALSEYHVALSRSALTDATFACLHLLALWAAVEALRRERAGLAVLAGLAVGAAWNTKYHGWLALVSAGLALAPLLLARARRGGPWLRPLALWVLMAGVAGLFYLPWALFVREQPGGYAALAAYQRTMLGGGWLHNLARHGGFQLFFEGPFGRASVPLAFAAALAFAPSAGADRRRLGLALLGLAAGALLLGGSLATYALATCAVPLLVRRARAGAEPDLRPLALLAWLGLWLALTPLYRPYARLLLPLSMAACLAAGLALQELAARVSGAFERSRAVAAAAGVAALVVLAALALPDPSDPWRSARGMERAAAALLPSIPAGARVVVLGDPGLAWFLQRAGRDAFEPVKGDAALEALEGAGGPAFVLCGIYPARTGAEERLVAAAGPRLERVAVAPMEVKDLRLLDDFAPRAAFGFRRRPGSAYDLRLYRFTPGP